MMNENRCICCGDIIPEGRQVCPICEASGLMHEPGYESLASAIVVNAAREYRKAKRKLEKKTDDYSSTNLINEITKFFKSKWAWFISPSDPEVILERLEHEKSDSVKKPVRAWEGLPKHRR